MDNTEGCFVDVNMNQVEVGMRLQFEPGEDDFEDVTFLVSNESDKEKAVDRVRKFVKLLAKEFADDVER